MLAPEQPRLSAHAHPHAALTVQIGDALIGAAVLRQDAEAVSMYQEHVRYMGEHELCNTTATSENPQGHNSHLNIEQLNKVRRRWLADLLAWYVRQWWPV